METLDWPIVITKPRDGSRVRLIPGRGVKRLRGSLQTDLTRTPGIPVQAVVIVPSAAPPEPTEWTDVSQVGATGKRGKLLFSHRDLAAPTNLPPGESFEIWIRAGRPERPFDQATTPIHKVRCEAR